MSQLRLKHALEKGNFYNKKLYPKAPLKDTYYCFRPNRRPSRPGRPASNLSSRPGPPYGSIPVELSQNPSLLESMIASLFIKNPENGTNSGQQRPPVIQSADVVFGGVPTGL